MNRELAEKFAHHYRLFGEWFNSMTGLSDQLEDEQAGKDLRRAVGAIWVKVNDLLYVPAAKDFPDLFDDPDTHDR